MHDDDPTIPPSQPDEDAPPFFAQIVLTVHLNQQLEIGGKVQSGDMLEAILLRALAHVQREQMLAYQARAIAAQKIHLPNGQPAATPRWPIR